MPEVRLLPRTTAFGYYDHNYLVLLERVTDHLPPAERRGRIAPAPLARARQAGGAGDRRPSSGRWSSPTTTGPA